MTPTSIRRFIWGLTIFGAGIILLLQSIEILPGFAWKFIWPTFIVIIGVELMLTAMFPAGEEFEVRLPKGLFKKARRRK
jgi:hypothetical protein